MSIHKKIEITCTCDGPCGTALTVQRAKVPEGWMLVHVNIPQPKQGESGTTASATFCPRCFERFQQILRHEGYAFVERERKAETADAETVDA